MNPQGATMQDILARLRDAIAAQHGQPFGSTAIARQLNTNPDRIGQLLALHARELDITIARHHPRQYRANGSDGHTLQALLGYRLPAAMPPGRHIPERHARGRSCTSSHMPRNSSSAFSAMESA
ncbi:hypothetical protein JW897_12140 [Chromobacterium alkanivorans]|uniref:hypothetical protein n=1 Tax=Chromobacterium alkanivorans TaxID=1071719 RepID=UPI0019673599|nr:hypothetical protein [Chromobacterium alkanivorans]MBN3004485.1 hypothetical protein [Chromobacterium alkanivorans]